MECQKKFYDNMFNKNTLGLYEFGSVMKTFTTAIGIEETKFFPNSMYEINDSIIEEDDEKFLLYSLISLNDKDWSNIHPEHLKLILKGYFQYKEGVLFRNIILEVFKNYKFII